MTKCEFLKDFIFCPKCGAEFIDNNIKSKKCVKCGFTYYFNPSAAVAAIIINTKGEILVSLRKNPPAKGSYDLPGGFVDSYETAEQSIIREVKEETNMDVVSTKYLFSQPNIYPYSNFDVHTIDMFFECEVADDENFTANDDVESLEFIASSEIDLSKFGLISIREGLRRYLSR